MRHHRRRHNPSSRGATGALMKGAFVLGGAIGSRWITQLALGSANTGWVGYAGNGVATWVLGWASGKFMGRGSATYVYIGGAAGIILRLLQDQGVIGKIPGLAGLGDPGVGALLPSQYLDPPLYTNVTSAQRIFPYALPAPAGPGAGMKGLGVVGTYARGSSSYGRRF